MAVSNLTMVSVMKTPDQQATAVAGCREKAAPPRVRRVRLCRRTRPRLPDGVVSPPPSQGRRGGLLPPSRQHRGSPRRQGERPPGAARRQPWGASLVNWICLEGHSVLHEGVASGAEAGRGHLRGPYGQRGAPVRRQPALRERGWRIGDRSGLTSKVLVCVDESNNSLVLARRQRRCGGRCRAPLDHPTPDDQSRGPVRPRRQRPEPVLRLPVRPHPGCPCAVPRPTSSPGTRWLRTRTGTRVKAQAAYTSASASPGLSVASSSRRPLRSQATSTGLRSALDPRRACGRGRPQ